MGVLDLQPGDVIKGYAVKRTLGRGGMGAVYLVAHPRLGTDVALKVMTVKAATEDDLRLARARFVREAQTLAKLRHPSIVRVNDFDEIVDEDGANPYIIMEYFPGVDGAKWIKAEPSLEAVRHVCLQLADALAVAHAAGILHRDLKYSNVLINDNNEALLIDFGIAKSEDDENITKTGYSVGTLSHLAPEYLGPSMRGQPFEHTVLTDLWAFGCMAYYFTCHRNAFSSGGEGHGRLFDAILNRPHPPVRSLRPDASPAWERLIDDLLQKDPAQRIQTAAALKKRLQELPAAADAAAVAFASSTTKPSAALSPALPPSVSVSVSASPAPLASSSSGASSSPSPSALLAHEAQTTDSPRQQATINQRAQRAPLPSVDNPFAAVAAASGHVAPSSSGPLPSSSVPLPPVDGTGINTARPARLSPPPVAAATAAALPAVDGTGVATPLPAPASVAAAKPTAPAALAEPVRAPSVEAAPAVQPPGVVPSAGVPSSSSSVAASAATAALENNTFLNSLKEAAFAAPHTPPSPAAPLASDESAVTPIPAPTSFPPPASDDSQLSAVAPLPSFAPPAPKAQQQSTALRSLALPLLAVLTIVILGLLGTSLLNRTPTAAQAAGVPSSPSPEDDAMKKAEERAQREMQDLERERAAAAARSASVAVPVAPLPPSSAGPASPASPPPAMPPVLKPRSSSLSSAPRVAGGEPAPAAPDVVDPIAARFGNRTGFNTSSVGTPAAQPGSATQPSTSSPVAGVKIPVRVDNEIASTPSPVVATVTQQTRVGSLTLPVGTQLHGQSSGGQGSRVAISFRFAIVGGQNVPLAGIALGADGRAGLPGSRTLGNGSDVAARAVGSAIGATTDAVAGIVGPNPGGEVIRGAGGAVAGKSDRLNTDEDVVVVKRGARFVVYVGN
jgi:serine/threonine-protein kinase